MKHYLFLFVLVAAAYLVGAKFPQLANKVGVS